MAKTYSGIGSRLCSDDCSDSYYAYVIGDRSAALGTGRRLVAWIQKHQPDFYRDLQRLRQDPVAVPEPASRPGKPAGE
ncbi:MAG: hypothetical protein WB716_07435, partial [Candidatus Acidiferrales bacterium]